MAEQEYRRLTRTRVRRKGLITAFSSRSSLWLGKDHMLCIDSTGYTEEYKRFYFRDIQAITVCRTGRRVVWNWVLSLLLIPCLAGLVTVLLSKTAAQTATLVILIVLACLFALPLLINNLLGTTCAAYLRTAVQVEELPPLSRLLHVHKVLNRIRPLVIEAQGQLVPEEIPGRLQAMLQSSGTVAVAGATPQTLIPDDPNAPPRMIP